MLSVFVDATQQYTQNNYDFGSGGWKLQVLAMKGREREIKQQMC
jgi:hypothetical protein